MDGNTGHIREKNNIIFMAANSLLICRFYTGFPSLQQTQTVKRAREVRFTQKDDKVIHVALALNYFSATLEFQRF